MDQPKSGIAVNGAGAVRQFRTRSMGGKCAQGVHTRLDREIIAEYLQGPGAVDQVPARRIVRLNTSENDMSVSRQMRCLKW